MVSTEKPTKAQSHNIFTDALQDNLSSLHQITFLGRAVHTRLAHTSVADTTRWRSYENGLGTGVGTTPRHQHPHALVAHSSAV